MASHPKATNLCDLEALILFQTTEARTNDLQDTLPRIKHLGCFHLVRMPYRASKESKKLGAERRKEGKKERRPGAQSSLD
jgi:hypothetical protein